MQDGRVMSASGVGRGRHRVTATGGYEGSGERYAPLIVLLRPKWNPVFVLAAAAVVGLIVHY